MSLTGEVVIIPDEVNNALVVRANAADYAKIKKTIETLDILPRAVLIDVVIAEIALTDELRYGLEAFFRNINAQVGATPASLGGLFKGGLAIDSLTSGAFPPSTSLATAGLGMFWATDNQKIGVLLQLLSEYTDVNVLSTPTLLAVDNKEASIMVGGREPVPTGSYASGTIGAGVLSTLNYEDTGIILNLIPHINAGGLVRLEVEQTIRRLGGERTVGGTTAPSFDERNVTTSLLAQDGSTVVIGGIIQTLTTDTHGGIPYLKNMPILGPLFTSTKRKATTKTELIVAVTPHVVEHRESEVTREFLERLRDLKNRIER